MRIFLTSVMAFFLSLLVGGMVGQFLAEATKAGQEYILVFIAVPLVATVVTVLFFIPQLFVLRRRAVDKTGKWTLAVFVVLTAALLVFDFVTIQGDVAMFRRDMPILAGLALPGFAIILVQWLFVRWRVGHPLAMGEQTA